MSGTVPAGDLMRWCRVPAEDLVDHPDRRIPLRLCRDSAEMGLLMARELVEEITRSAREGTTLRIVVPCGPSCWYAPFTELVNARRVNLSHVEVFHMDECLDWEGTQLPRNHPYSFRGFMERNFYGPIAPELNVPQARRHWPEPDALDEISRNLVEQPADLVYGGWGQDGHIAYNQARRHPYSPVTVQQLRASTARVQDNNLDTVIALAQRTFGGAYQFVPPMSVTLGLSEILPARKIRLFSDTGAWKQTALRVALFSEVTPEYPITLLQEHSDALLTATVETAQHPVSQHPEWDLGVLP
ncbi:glucosamine-6-phosphate deaminase [Asanoa ferruginea]|uniref:Glucosamine-6-phosphate deaminase n=1 Tax=Asanoa ferruginea TaxID=53367 RepID=A0A3D9ZS57_9ACTN|nr:6-phosphogluconolactonase [Asanoa ferruginea]REF99719.1 glucosamine-6-phosphate deaminase [Asanoa ferruginea]GIF50430.1 glucosamine-6-phosphate isomerase [Asanoa ferruginea]